MKKSVLYSMLVGLILVFTNCCPSKIIYCDAISKTNPVNVLRDPNKAFPVFARDYGASVKAAINVLEKVDIANAEIGFNNKIVALRDNLSQEYAVIQDLIKSNYLKSWQNPCNDEVRKDFDNNLKMLSDKVIELKKLQIELVPLIENKDKQGIRDNTQKKIENVIDRFNGNYNVQKITL